MDEFFSDTEAKAESLIGFVRGQARSAFTLNDPLAELVCEHNWRPICEALGPLSELEQALLHEVWVIEMHSMKERYKHDRHVRVDGFVRYKCASDNCPGYPYRASDMAHPVETCG